MILVASEVVGFAKTGGLADVAGSLPRALAGRGHDVVVVMPFYQAVRLGATKAIAIGQPFSVLVGNRSIDCRLFRSTLPDSDVPIVFIDAPDYFNRDDAKAGLGLYQQMMPGGYRADYPDNAERFVFFCRAVLEAIPRFGPMPEIIHANDWQTGLLAPMLVELYRRRAGWENVRTLFTIHNIAYQGMFNRDILPLTGLPGWSFNHTQLEFYGFLNFLKAGIVFSDAVCTVSPTYAREIQTPEYGCGLDGVLVEARDRLHGIVNGVDYSVWNPATDIFLPARYDIETVFQHKPKCKTAVQERFHLNLDPKAPTLGVVARLVSQKGIDLILSAAPGMLDLGCQLVFLGEGDPELHHTLRMFKEQYPKQVGLYLGFDEGLAHLVEAGSDMFLMPSRYEPSGLNQLYSLKYGTPPIVRSTGGLADTIEHGVTGFRFDDYSADALYRCVTDAVDCYRNRKDEFRRIVVNAMRQDWSWDRSAVLYEGLYHKIMAG